MYTQDFYSYDMNVGQVLSEMADWIKENNPKVPIITIIAQNAIYIHFRIYYD